MDIKWAGWVRYIRFDYYYYSDGETEHVDSIPLPLYPLLIHDINLRYKHTVATFVRMNPQYIYIYIHSSYEMGKIKQWLQGGETGNGVGLK